MFAQLDDSALSDVVMVAGVDGTTNPKMVCWHCDKPGHGRNNCPSNPSVKQGVTHCCNRKKGITNLMMAFSFAQRSGLV